MKASFKQSIAASLLALGMASASLLVAGSTNAAERRVAAERFTEYADVIYVQPIYKNIRVREPRRECWIETQQQLVGYESPRYERRQARRTNRRYSSSGTVVGSLIGGVIGNQISRGSNGGTRAGATIAGAIIGGAVANEARGNVLRHRNQPVRSSKRGAPIYKTVKVERCKKVSESRFEKRVQHYDVTYRYKGRTYTTRTKRDPGRQIKLQVSIAPTR